MAKTRRPAAGVAALVATLAIVAAPAAAPAQVQLPPVDLSETLAKPVDDVGRAVENQLVTIAPGVIEPGQPGQTSPAQAASPVESPAGDPGNDPTADAAPPSADPEPDPGVRAGDSEASAQVTAAGDGADRPATGPGAAPSDDSASSQPTAEQGSSPPSPDRGSVGRGPGVLERFVSVVPTPIKIAVGLLAELFAIAAFVAWRTRRRLRTAERLAATDALTGLPNRRSAEEVLGRLVASAQRHERALSVVLFDLDHFKAINDRHGHATGDEALRAAATATRSALRAGDHVARFGGEEFLVILPETGGEDAHVVAEKLRAAIAGVAVAGTEQGITASFGVAVEPGDGAGAEELVAAADQALYCAKEAGRNRVELAESAPAGVAALA